MRNEWYGDNRDVVKWSTLVHLASRETIRYILQIAMFRPDDDRPQLGTFQADRVVPLKPLPEEVVHHFSRDLDLNDIQRLADSTGFCIDVTNEPFIDRQEYFDRVCERIKRYAAPVVAFLDPDTGLAPQSPSLQHVTESDLISVFSTLRSGGVLVSYQHGWRKKGWEELSRQKFARWLRVSEVETFKSELASDAILLAVKKP